jgi:DNA-binding NarL/FixJ family response regulator
MQTLAVVAGDVAAMRSNRFALRHLECVRVIGTVDGRAPIRDELARLQPQVVLVNDMAHRINLLSRIREAAEAVPRAVIVLLSGRVDPAAIDEAVDAGARVVIARDLPPAVLGGALADIVQGNVAMSPRRREGQRADSLTDQLAPVARTRA